MSPKNRKKLEKIRKKLDRLDNEFLRLIKIRTDLVNKVVKLKEFKGEIVDTKRIKKILFDIRRKSLKKKIDSNAPHETFLILDATTGQSVIGQVEEFKKITPITGIIMTKLDGTAKGGILLAIGRKFKLPIIALGMGEKEDDLQTFNSEYFANALMHF